MAKKKKKKKKHKLVIPPRGPQSETYARRRKKFRVPVGLSDEALKELGYKYPLGRLQKVLFVLSICLCMLPFWFILEKKDYAERAWPALRAFGLHLFLWFLLASLLMGWDVVSVVVRR